MDIHKIIGINIRKHREKLKLTQQDLAELADLSINFIGQIERGTKKASLDTIKKLSDVLKIPMHKITDESESVFKIKKNYDFDSYIITNRVTGLFKDKSFLIELKKIILK